ncbi:hypothetical protein LCGC14_1632060 [marine sediment metagenome]|uniref:Uncharacterized protein n=1 Tax=marine sediment metagenome TaxID=412755 RepID=A0A0F9KHX9_9ZZZZ
MLEMGLLKRLLRAIAKVTVFSLSIEIPKDSNSLSTRVPPSSQVSPLSSSLSKTLGSSGSGFVSGSGLVFFLYFF